MTCTWEQLFFICSLSYFCDKPEYSFSLHTWQDMHWQSSDFMKFYSSFIVSSFTGPYCTIPSDETAGAQRCLYLQVLIYSKTSGSTSDNIEFGLPAKFLQSGQWGIYGLMTEPELSLNSRALSLFSSCNNLTWHGLQNIFLHSLHSSGITGAIPQQSHVI